MCGKDSTRKAEYSLYKVRYAVFPLIILIFLVGLILIPSPWALEQGPSLYARTERTSAAIGEIVEITLTFVLPEGAKRVSPPEIKGLEGLTVLKILEEGDQIILRLLVDSLGSWKTGEISMSYRAGNGELATVKTDPVSLTVHSNLGEKPEGAQLRPIQDIIPARPVWMKYALWTIILLGVAGIIWLFVLRLRRRGREGLSKEIDDPPHIRARKEIEELEGLGLFESGQVKRYYFRFSEITREYLKALRHFPAAEYTTEEIAACIREEKDRGLIPILREADLVKFADLVPSLNRKEEQIKEVLSYISKTSGIADTGEKTAVSGGPVP